MTVEKSYDILIIGAGPAGLTAGIYASWVGLKTLILEAGISGGRAWLAPKIENFPGFENGIAGQELSDKMTRQAERLGAEIKMPEEIVDLDLKGEIKKVFSRKQTYQTLSAIIATGTQRKKLHVPGETEFLGRGVSYCAVCDGPFFKKAKVAIVGNSEEVAIDALYLSDLASNVLIVTQNGNLEVEGALEERLKNRNNIEIVKGKVTAIVGDQVAKKIKIQQHDTQTEAEKEVNGVFISIGGVPMTEIVKKAGISTDRNGCLSVDRMQRTNIEGVFAAGDCTCGGMQVVTAAGEGAMAAMKASTYIRNKKR